MRAIFIVSFLILCAVLSQEMVVAFDDNLELSSVPHNRQKRMEPPRGTIHVYDLPPFLAYNLRKEHLINPTEVWITTNGLYSDIGYAIHPYLVLTSRISIGSGRNYGVSMLLKYERNYVPQRVETYYPDPDDQFVVILLEAPLLMDDPVPGALANYPITVINWAHHVVEEWIRTQLRTLRPLLEQNLHELHFDHPTAVQITSNGVRIGPGYAIHPYIVMTHRRFVGRNYGVAVPTGTRGELSPRRAQIPFTNSYEQVVVILLLDPILLTQDAPGALSAEGYSHDAIAWVHAVAENWKHNMLINQANFYDENSV